MGKEEKEYIVKVSAAKMPLNCWGRYVRVAVIEVDPGVEDVTMISKRARGELRVVEVWEACHVGTTDRCASERAITAAYELIDELCNEDKA